MRQYQEVGQGKVFNLAERLTTRSLGGMVKNITGNMIRVSFPIDMANGVHGVEADFLREQFEIEPRIGLEVRANNYKIKPRIPTTSRRSR